MPIVRQTAFAAGEIAPELWGRTDLAKYQVALKRARNFFITRQGQAKSRPGSTKQGTVKASADGKVRLLPFVYSDSLTFVLEFGNLYIRFWSAGALVTNAGPVFEVVTPYVTADLPLLKACQQGALVTLTHPSYPPAELTFGGASNHDWTYAAISFDRPAISGAGPTFQFLNRMAVTPAAPNASPIDIAPDNTHQAREWAYQLTQIRKDSRGTLYETAPFTLVNMFLRNYLPWNTLVTYHAGTYVESGGTQYVATNPSTSIMPPNAGFWAVDATSVSPPHGQFDPIPVSTATANLLSGVAGIVCEPDRPVQVIVGALYGLASVDPNFVAYRVYRGQGGLYGWVGDTKSATFTDVGATPDYTRQPPQGTNPFKFYDTSGVLTSTEYPACCTYFDGRRFFARTAQRPGFFWGSAVNDYSNFDTPLLPTASSAIAFEIASRKLEEIRFMVGVGPKLLLGTQSAPWSVSGSQGPVSATSIDVKREGEAGASWVEPLVVDESCLFIRTKGTGVRSLTYDFRVQGFTGSDLSILAPHLVVGYQLTDWCYAEDPWSLVFAVRNDGKLCVLTYVREQELWAWSTYDTAGTYEAVCSVPEGQEDAVYAVVLRNGVRYVERFASRVILEANMSQAVCLDSAVVYSGVATTAITGLDHLEGLEVMALADGNVSGPFTVAGGAITLPDAASYVVAGLSYLPQLQTLNPSMASIDTKTLNKQVSRAGIEVDNSRGLFVGPDFDHLDEWVQRTVAASYGTIALETGLENQWIQGDWGLDGDVCLQQNDPLPITVTSIARELLLGEP